MQQASTVQAEGAAWRAVLAALLAIFVGIGLSRFAYTPLIPAIIEAGWFTPSDAVYLGAANLAGYLVGALGGRQLASLCSATAALKGLMLLASLAFAASAVPLSFGWYCLWRLIAGITGGGLMVLAAPTVLALVPAGRRGLAAGTIFVGVGLGIVLAGTLVPSLLVHGLRATWLGLAALSFAVTGLAWFWWPIAGAGTPQSRVAAAVETQELRAAGLMAVYASYGLIAIGLVPHMVFLADFVARGLALGIDVAGRYWVLFGFGALVGPIMAGGLADRLGFSRALHTMLVLHIAGVAAIAVDQSTAALVVSSLVVGSAISGTVPLVLGQTQERVSSAEAQKTAWAVATATFALGQAVGGYAYAYLFASTGGDFALLFMLGATALVLALLTNLMARPAEKEGANQ